MLVSTTIFAGAGLGAEPFLLRGTPKTATRWLCSVVFVAFPPIVDTVLFLTSVASNDWAEARGAVRKASSPGAQQVYDASTMESSLYLSLSPTRTPMITSNYQNIRIKTLPPTPIYLRETEIFSLSSLFWVDFFVNNVYVASG
ncbi:hypothetical protein ARMGADRAFT_1026055 [Armillaria gallica]|uniref:Uncharacterized protein n=1 Tax=Armillaria gallica TaxID=47427 RepID=A0A2H3DXL0_ARMGA|nr:hypothetical protein ARMGADRAFT_1026055 [Armillaria gallica]